MPFLIACGRRFSCRKGMFSLCEKLHPERMGRLEKMWGSLPPAFFGDSHLLGGDAGGSGRICRVPFAERSGR